MHLSQQNSQMISMNTKIGCQLKSGEKDVRPSLNAKIHVQSIWENQRWFSQ
jgi:hypothetical protein